jgi:Type II/IV secretion system protein
MSQARIRRRSWEWLEGRIAQEIRAAERLRRSSSRRKSFVELLAEHTLNEKSLMVAVKNIARRLGDDISEEKPILDSRLPDGSRVAAVIPPCSLKGVVLTIRKFNARRFGIDDLTRSLPTKAPPRVQPSPTFCVTPRPPAGHSESCYRGRAH